MVDLILSEDLPVAPSLLSYQDQDFGQMNN